MDPSSPAADPKPLLAAANSASEKVAALHIVFLAVCAYVLVIVFGTTDTDLLIGKGVKLPVVDVEVPIVGFYILAPYLLVLVHFNLLLCLQLLSRKLYAFDEAARGSGTGELYEQLNIFPYNYYLIGRPNRLVRGFLALAVTITILFLPLAALLTLQARFLAYQNEAVTWAQRVATWLDVALVVVLWPVIMDRRDSWSGYFSSVCRHARLHWISWLWGLAGLVIVVALLETRISVSPVSILAPGLTPLASVVAKVAKLWIVKLLAVWLFLTIVTPVLRYGVRRLRPASDVESPPELLLGVPGLLTIVLIGLPIPLLLVANGERIDRPNAVATELLTSLRSLDVHEKVLLAKPPSPETLADLRSEDPARRQAALRSVQRLDLQNRSLRRANLAHALLPRADLRGAQLQGAFLLGAQLQGVDLTGAILQDVAFVETQLQGANFTKARFLRTAFVETWLDGAQFKETDLRGAIFSEVQLQGADLSGAQLTNANLSETALRGANLSRAQLSGATLSRVFLEGVNLSSAQLQGANLSWAHLEGADLSSAKLAGARLSEADLQAATLSQAELLGADLSGARLQGADLSVAELTAADLSRAQLQGANLSYARLEGANLSGALLQGTNLSNAWLTATSLKGAVLYTEWRTAWPVDARGLKWQPIEAKELAMLREEQARLPWRRKDDLARYGAAIEKAAGPRVKPPEIESCLRDSNTQVPCKESLSTAQFRASLLQRLEALACQSPEIARGVFRRFEPPTEVGDGSPTQDLALRLQTIVTKPPADNSCPGLAGLARKDKDLLAGLAARDKAPIEGASKTTAPR